jgi:hypothetical protein
MAPIIGGTSVGSPLTGLSLAVNAQPKQPHLCIENSHTWSLVSVCLMNVADATSTQDFLVRDRLVASWILGES